MANKQQILQRLEELGFPLPDKSELNSRDGLEFAWSATFNQRYKYLVRSGQFAEWPVCLTKNHYPTVYKGGRESKALNSCQIIFFVRDDQHMIEADIDTFNPDQGLAPAIAHEVFDVWWLTIKRKFRKG